MDICAFENYPKSGSEDNYFPLSLGLRENRD